MIKLTLGVGGLEGRFVGSGVGFEVGATPQPAPPFH